MTLCAKGWHLMCGARLEGLGRPIRGAPRARPEGLVHQEGWNGRGRLAEDEGLQALSGDEQMFDEAMTVGQNHHGASRMVRDLAALLKTQTDLAVGEHRPVSLAFGPEHRLVPMAGDFSRAGASTKASGSSRSLHLKGLPFEAQGMLAQRSLLSKQPQYTAVRRPFLTREPNRPRLFRD